MSELSWNERVRNVYWAANRIGMTISVDPENLYLQQGAKFVAIGKIDYMERVVDRLGKLKAFL
jgi:hypothetical protein